MAEEPLKNEPTGQEPPPPYPKPPGTNEKEKGPNPRMILNQLESETAPPVPEKATTGPTAEAQPASPQPSPGPKVASPEDVMTDAMRRLDDLIKKIKEKNAGMP